MNKSLYELQAKICGALAHPIRLEILDLLAREELTSSDIGSALQIPKANVSLHLNLLKDAGVVVARKQGLYQHWSLSFPEIKRACSMLRDVLEQKLAADASVSVKLKNALKISQKKGA